MREFAIAIPRTILRGLRAFPSPRSGEEECVECYNLAPGEHSLRGHTPLVALGITNPTFEYFAVRDQASIIWYWSVGRTLDVLFDTIAPVVSAFGFVAVSLTPATIPYWIQVDAADNVATQLFIFPAENTGDLLVDTIAPPIGTGYDAGLGLDVRSLDGWKKRITALTTQDVFVRRVGE